MPKAIDDFRQRLARHALERPEGIALDDGVRQVTWAQLARQLKARHKRLAECEARRVALALDNGIDWALWNLTLLFGSRVVVPVPGFFSAQQRHHLVQSAGLDAWIGPGAEALGFTIGGTPDIATRRVVAPPLLHPGTSCITFTSGTSGKPKGVCLDGSTLLRVAFSLAKAVSPLAIERHLAMLPLATLLENIGGLYVPLWLGATACLPGMAELGWQGGRGFDPHRALSTLGCYRPHSLILMPQLLQALVALAEHAPDYLRFVAVGGARLAVSVFEQARERGWPVYEGYGLSESASVVCLNRPGEPHCGVGRPLPHAQVKIDASGEVHICGTIMLGYLGGSRAGECYATGDLGHWRDGALVLDGRRRDVFITAYGRNVDPQWVEGELCAHPAISQALLHGEDLSHNRALIVPADPDTDDNELETAIIAVNAMLPDYARVHEWRRSTPFTPGNGQQTANGRLRRSAILAAHRHWLAAPSLTHFIPQNTVSRSTDMTPYQRLQDSTHTEREWLLSAPLITRTLDGQANYEEYLAFLGQAYHHVRFTVPLMMACGARLPDRLGWLRDALVEYIEEENGHEQWILDDIRAAGGNPVEVVRTHPDPATHLMVAYVRDVIEHGNPVGFFGMVQVLEGTSTALATQAAARLQASLGLPDDAVRYLTSHGSLDIGHLAFFEGLMNRLEEDDLEAVIETASMVYRLYGAMFRGIDARLNGDNISRELANALA